MDRYFGYNGGTSLNLDMDGINRALGRLYFSHNLLVYGCLQAFLMSFFGYGYFRRNIKRREWTVAILPGGLQMVFAASSQHNGFPESVLHCVCFSSFLLLHYLLSIGMDGFSRIDFSTRHWRGGQGLSYYIGDGGEERGGWSKSNHEREVWLTC